MIKKHLPGVRRVSSYCLPRNIRGKTMEQLRELKSLGLSILYVGCESGDDEVLRRVNKGETFDSSVDALRKVRESGIKGLNYTRNSTFRHILTYADILVYTSNVTCSCRFFWVTGSTCEVRLAIH